MSRIETKYLIPNALTLARPFFARRAVTEYKQGHLPKALGLFAAALLTDADGTVARALDATSEFGKWADPVADRLMLVELVRGLEMDPKARKVMLAAEGIMVIGALGLLAKAKNKQEAPAARPIGKARMVVHGLAGLQLMRKPKDKVASWAMAAASVVTLADYSREALRRTK